MAPRRCQVRALACGLGLGLMWGLGTELQMHGQWCRRGDDGMGYDDNPQSVRRYGVVTSMRTKTPWLAIWWPMTRA
jgi:hypothetical protein